MNYTETEIRKVITDYKKKREEVLKPLKNYRKETEKGLNYGQHEAQICNDCYSDLTTSLEAKNFFDLTDQIGNDPELGSIFNPIFLEVAIMNHQG